MNLLKQEQGEKSTIKIEFSIDKAVFDAAVDKVYRRQVKKINVPGFRAGKAPRAIIEKMYGSGVFYEDAINDLIPENYTAAVKEAGIDPVGQPEIDIVSIDENGLVLSAIVPVKPECKLEGYKGLDIAKVVEPVSDEEIENEIKTIRERQSREIEVEDETPAAMGDIAKIDFEGFIDGVAFEGGKGENYSLKLGSGSFIPGFEEQVAGHKIGDEFDVNVPFPADYHAEELAGKEACFKCKVNAITKIELPELDDDFAKDVSEFDTLDEYKADLKAKIEKRHENAANAEFEEKLIDALIEKLEADIPEAMFVAETENFVRDYDNRLRQSGLDLKTYFQYTGLDLDKLREQMRPQAEKQVKARLALETIAKAEAIEVTEEELTAEYELIATTYNIDKEQVKSMVDEAMVKADVSVRKAMQVVKDNVKAPKKASKPRKKKVAEPVAEEAAPEATEEAKTEE
ncbi:MAG: trigger factor [Clostridia bacterium]|nr:trigger factor [Clostridia bacterium]